MTVGDLLEYVSFQLSKNHVGIDDTVYVGHQPHDDIQMWAAQVTMGKHGLEIEAWNLPNQE